MHIVSGDLWAGAEVLVAALLREQHHAAPGNIGCVILNSGRLCTELVNAGIAVVLLEESTNGFASLARKVRSALSDFSPDVVHSHRQKENFLAVVATKSRLGKRPRLITTIHGMPEPFAGSSIKRRLIRGMNWAIIRFGFDSVVGVSHDIAVAMRESAKADRVVCIHNGLRVPNAGEIPAPRPKAGTSLQLVALGRLVPIKRFERLRALADLLARTPIGRPRLLLAGDGPLRSDLAQVLTPAGETTGIEMLGHLDDPAALLRTSDGLIITSDHEGLPMAALEALSAGIPLFAFRTGGLPELATDGAPVLLAPAYDIDALAREIVTYFTNHPNRRRWVPPDTWQFDIRQCASAYGRLYSDLVSRRSQ